MSKQDLYLTLSVIALFICLLAGAWLCYAGLINLLRYRLGKRGCIQISVGLILLCSCYSFFLVWYRMVVQIAP